MTEPTALDASRIDVVLFDLGNVVFGFDWNAAIDVWATASGAQPNLLRDRLVFGDDLARFERGELSEDEYFSLLRAQLGVELETHELIEGWNAIFGSLCPGIVDAIEAVAASPLRIAGLSNTNETHTRAWTAKFAPQIARLGKVFTSQELGHRKPEAACYREVIARLGVVPSSVVLLDDLEANITAARAIGMQGVVVASPDDVRAALATLGITPR